MAEQAASLFLPASLPLGCTASIGGVSLEYRAALIVPPARILQTGEINSTVASSSSFTNDGTRFGNAVLLLLGGNDTLRLGIPRWAEPISLAPALNHSFITSTELVGATLGPSNPGITAAPAINETRAGSVNSIESLQLPISLSPPLSPLSKDAVSIHMPQASILRALCGMATHTPAGAAPSPPPSSTVIPIDCELQLTWTLRLQLNVSSNGHDNAEGDSSASSSKLPPQLFHTQHCPPDCAGFNSGGLVTFVDPCSGYHMGPECRDHETAHAAGCAFGTPTGGTCRRCPEHAACPGGSRAWPGPGFWTPHEAAGTLYPCAPPATTRCRGWSIAARSSACGVGYDPSVPLCGACASGFFLRDGVCTPCTAIQGPQQQPPLVALACLLGAVLGIFGVLAAALTRAFHVTRLPTTRKLGVRIAVEVTVWLLSTLQVLIQLTRTASPGLPFWLRSVFSYVQALESDITGLLPAGCHGDSPFSYTNTVCSLELSFTVLFATLGVLRLRRDCRVRSASQASSVPRPLSGPGRPAIPNNGLLAWLQFLSSTFAVLVYGPALAKSGDALRCVTVMRPVVSARGLTLLPAHVWELDTRILCYEGDHAITAGLAWLTLVIAGLGLPMLLFVMASLHLRAVLPSLKGPIEDGNALKDEKDASHKSFRLSVESFPKRGNRVPSRRKTCCAIFRTLPEEQHQPLRQYRAWSVLYGYGQPWVRPSSVALTMCVTALSSGLPPNEYPLARAISLGFLLVAAAVICVWPSVTLDHQWSSWKRWPRGLTYAASAGLVALQCVLAMADHQATAVVTVLSWVVVVCVASLPLVLVASLVAWLTSMVSCRAFWCCCCGPRRLVAKTGNSKGLAAMLAFTMSFASETMVRKLVRHAGQASVVTAMASAQPAASLRALQASVRRARKSAGSGSRSTGSTSLKEGKVASGPPLHPHATGPENTRLMPFRKPNIAAPTVRKRVEAVTSAVSPLSLDDLPWDTATQNPLCHKPGRLHTDSRGAFMAVNPLRTALQRATVSQNQAAKEEASGAGANPGVNPKDVAPEEEEGTPDSRAPGSTSTRLRFGGTRGGALRYDLGNHRGARDSNAIYSQLVRRKVGDAVAQSLKSYAKDIATRSNKARKPRP